MGAEWTTNATARTVRKHSNCGRKRSPYKIRGGRVEHRLLNSCEIERKSYASIDMRLAGILCNEFFRVHNIPYRFRGKYRKEKKITFKDIMDFKWDLEREEQNMLLLRHPYLTTEQSRGHMTDFKSEKMVNKKILWQEIRNAKFNKRITITDRLNYYILNEPWE